LGGRIVSTPDKPMKLRNIRPALCALGLLGAAYLPAFAVVSFIRPRVELAIPLVIGISFSIALLLIFFLGRHGPGFQAFGFAVPQRRDFPAGLLLGPPLALAVAWLSRMFPSKPLFDVSAFPLWMTGLYFVVAAPVQEEVIFRGLIQSFLQQRWQITLSLFGKGLSPAVGCTAILFSVVHVGAGPVVVIGAMALSFLAGELRRRTGNLIPAVLVHALFNLTGALWPGA
jgi:membrane protease YdiL (CAAX protease family)